MSNKSTTPTTPLLRCDLCHITLFDSYSLESHFTGKKHQKAARNVDLRTRQEGKAVYVTGLGELKLTEVHGYMNTFGTVVNLAVGENKDIPGRLHHVIVEFESEEVVSAILSKKIRDKHKVEVPGSNPPAFRTIKIFERKFKEQRPKSPSPPVCNGVSHEQVKLRLALLWECEEQLEELVNLTHIDAEEVQQRVDICKNIQRTFSRTQFSSCILYPFGSSVSRLGFPGCDLDIYLELGDPVETSSSSSLMNNIPISMTEQQKVRSAMKVLREIPQCSRLNPILAARVPILKFVHRPTGIHCDISFKDRTSVRNTEFIRFCTETDTRVRSLMVSVRYFARHYGLAGGGGGLKMSNYALTMLVIVYLQQLEQPLLHSVLELQAVPGLEKDIINNWNCNFCQDLSKIRPLPVNTSSTLQLLAGFLQFFSKLDFASFILCPLLGKVVPKTEFLSPSFMQTPLLSIPSILGPTGLQTEKAICLQDPFELSHNVCRNLPDKAVKILVNHLEEASNVVNSCILQETRPVGGLLNMFCMEVRVEEVVKEEKINNLLKEVEISKKILFINNFNIPLNQEYLSWFSESVQCGVGGDDTGDKSDFILECMNHLLEIALGDCLKMIEQEVDIKNVNLENYDNAELNISDQINADKVVPAVDKKGLAESGTKRCGSEDGAETLNKRSKLYPSPVYRAGAAWTVWSQVWVGRRKLGAILEKGDLDTTKWEARISEKVMEMEVRLAEPEVAFRVHMLSRREAGCVWVGLEKLHSRKKAFESLVTWLSSFIPDLVDRLAKEKVEDVKKIVNQTKKKMDYPIENDKQDVTKV